jgi:hypothetical protein
MAARGELPAGAKGIQPRKWLGASCRPVGGSAEVVFNGGLVPFWGLFLLGAALIALSARDLDQPNQGAILTAASGMALWLFIPHRVREVRVERSAVVVERLLWRRIYSFSHVRRVSLASVSEGLFSLRVARLTLSDGSEVLLGPVLAGGDEVLDAVSEAWQRWEASPGSTPAPHTFVRRAASLAIALAPAASIVAALLWVSSEPELQCHELARPVVLKEVRARSKRSRELYELIGEDGRSYRLRGAKAEIAPIRRALQRDPHTPLVLDLDEVRHHTPYVPMIGGAEITFACAIRRGEQRYSSIEQPRGDSRWYGLLLALPIALAGAVSAFRVLSPQLWRGARER